MRIIHSMENSDGLQHILAEYFGADVAATGVGRHVSQLERHGDLTRWRAARAELPQVATGWRMEQGRLIAGDLAANQAALNELLKTFIPWRKGPLQLGGVVIETEWRSDMKWDRIAAHLDLAGKKVLDVGAGNGYFGWRMLAEGAALVVGCDPTQLFVIQHEVIGHFAGPVPNVLLALRLEELPEGLASFDTVFSMGVLYHRRDHQAHLSDLAARLKPGGELVLETLVIPGDDEAVLVPDDRYANMRNVHALPTVPMLERWLKQAGYIDIRSIDVTPTTSSEQRSTDWMPFHSLAQALDPHDASKTIEGHPAPLRAVVLARY